MSSSESVRRDRNPEWYYCDSIGKEYGPLSSPVMRKWLLMGRFPPGPNLLVRLSDWPSFFPLSVLYPDYDSCFCIPPRNPYATKNMTSPLQTQGLERGYPVAENMAYQGNED
eukprot:gnl/MRDRNA2_/MRDRNA2_308807_c0_seq1.p1 gnl/MRDRNA2_/MRDRNA2_308807_c0~~gnl/MRDRNA2_/MRDRNA2_308807_c0_seq1.p1  ORF type:complete len:128 (+),score=6.51 gnl/MRDRNA2_/MRDRNA2_308807_c0_seq1:51-386(+)